MVETLKRAETNKSKGVLVSRVWYWYSSKYAKILSQRLTCLVRLGFELQEEDDPDHDKLYNAILQGRTGVRYGIFGSLFVY